MLASKNYKLPGGDLPFGHIWVLLTGSDLRNGYCCNKILLDMNIKSI
jgi:hypothetical protein